MRLNKLVWYPDLYGLITTTYELHCVYCSHSGAVLCIQFAKTQWQPSGKLHSQLKEGFVRTQQTPLVTGLVWCVLLCEVSWRIWSEPENVHVFASLQVTMVWMLMSEIVLISCLILQPLMKPCRHKLLSTTWSSRPTWLPWPLKLPVTRSEYTHTPCTLPSTCTNKLG